MEWREEARFGMFIHGGIYSKIAGEYLYVMARRRRGKEVLIISLASANIQIKVLNLLDYKGKLQGSKLQQEQGLRSQKGEKGDAC